MKALPYFAAALLFAIQPSVASAADVVEKRVEYKEGETKLVGFEYTSDKVTAASPSVLVFSDWMGIGDFAKEQGKELARLGYRAFVADIYGDAHRATDQKEAGALATKYKSDRPLLQARALAGLEALRKTAPSGLKKVGAIGFCFGGTAALELVRAGGPLDAVVTFHGGLETPDKSLAKNIKARLLVLHGADDPFVKDEEVTAFKKEMNDGKVPFEIREYSGAVHAFTQKEAGTDNSKGAAYNEYAAKHSFSAMREFFTEVFSD